MCYQMKEKQKEELKVAEFHNRILHRVTIQCGLARHHSPNVEKLMDHKVVNRKIDHDGANNLFIISLHVT